VANGLRRAFTSPRRLIGLAFLVLYYLLLFRPAFTRPAGSPEFGGRFGEGIPFPPMQIVDAIVFGGFVLLSLIFLLGAGAVKGTFRAADVDVLFPTPVDPRLVLGFRLLRDTLLTLIIPLIVVLLLYRPAAAGWTAMFRDVPSPETAGYVLRTAVAAYLLLTLAWVTIGYASGLFLNRPSDLHDRLRTAFSWLVAAGFIGLAGTVAYLVSDPARLVALAHHPALRLALIPPSAATMLAMAPIQGSWLLAVTGGGGLLALAGLGLWACLRQSGWLYEHAAMRVDATANAQALARQGDTFGVLADAARRGKLRAGRTGWIGRLRLKGAAALVWKEYIVQSRAMRLVLLVQFLVVGGMLSVMPALTMQGRARTAGLFFLAMQAFGAFMFAAIQAQSGFIEMLRRVDLLKPLPFTPVRTVAPEIAAKAFFPALASLVGAAVFVALRPEAWDAALASAILMPTLALVLGSLFAVLSVLFPEVDDPTQRGFRALVNLVGLVLLGGPGLLVFGLLLAAGLSPAIAALPVAAVNVLLAMLGARVAGDLYGGFNPSE
jgi:hypothetical protein